MSNIEAVIIGSCNIFFNGYYIRLSVSLHLFSALDPLPYNKPDDDEAHIFVFLFSLSIIECDCCLVLDYCSNAVIILICSFNSIAHEYKDWKDIIQSGTPPQEVDADKEIIFTYDVNFEESDLKWASRWDSYLLIYDDQIHWFSIINSLMIVLFLSGMVAMIMMRTLYRDIANYNQLETQDMAQEEAGWKLVHADVFRPPLNSSLLCVYVVTGVQVFAMTLVTMIFALLGFLSPSNRRG